MGSKDTTALSADHAFGNGPVDRITGKAADLVCVREVQIPVGDGGDTGVVVQHNSQLLTGDRGIGTKVAVSVSGGDALGDGPLDGGSTPIERAALIEVSS